VLHLYHKYIKTRLMTIFKKRIFRQLFEILSVTKNNYDIMYMSACSKVNISEMYNYEHQKYPNFFHVS
jgi:hypothetical protein